MRASVKQVFRVVLPDVANGVNLVKALTGLLLDGVQASKMIFTSVRWVGTDGLQATLRFNRTSPKNIVTMSGNGHWDVGGIDSDGAGLNGDLQIFVAGGGAGQGITLEVLVDVIK